eukprot:6203773-Pleurochrysis_carterae.AAC.2
MAMPADEQASEKRSSARTGGREERSRRPASECGGGIGSTRPAGLEDVEREGSWLHQEHTPIKGLGARVGGERRAPPAPAPPPTLPGEGRRARPRSGRTPA